jgi:hypothetical protein
MMIHWKDQSVLLTIEVCLDDISLCHHDLIDTLWYSKPNVDHRLLIIMKQLHIYWMRDELSAQKMIVCTQEYTLVILLPHPKGEPYKHLLNIVLSNEGDQV